MDIMEQTPNQEIELLHQPFVGLSNPLKSDKETELVIKVGRIPHPMEINHHIEWIEIFQDGKLIQKREFDPSLDREAITFLVINPQENFNLEIKAKCNLHGIWSKTISQQDLKDLEVIQ